LSSLLGTVGPTLGTSTSDLAEIEEIGLVGRHAMKKRAAFGCVVLIAALGSVGFATAAQADPDARFELTVDRHVVHGGEQFTATATANVGCDWVLEWNGDRRVKATRVLVATYTAPPVSRITRIPLHSTCFYDPPSAQRSSARDTSPAAWDHATTQRLTVTVPPSWRRTIVITVLPRGSAVSPPDIGGGLTNGGGLANTGGPMLWLLLVGLGSVLTGAVAVRTSLCNVRRIGPGPHFV
jgi:hypothetical protein